MDLFSISRAAFLFWAWNILHLGAEIFKSKEDIIKGEDVALTCRIKNFDSAYYSAKWRKEGIFADLTHCWSQTFSKHICIPSSLNDSKYSFTTTNNSIVLKIHNFNQDDSGTWICVDPEKRKSNCTIDYKDALIPPAHCTLMRQRSGNYSCSSSCIGPAEKVLMKWRFSPDSGMSVYLSLYSAFPTMGDPIPLGFYCGNKHSENLAVQEFVFSHRVDEIISNCSSTEKEFKIRLHGEDYLSGKGNLSCSCGIIGHEKYTIHSNAFDVNFGSNVSTDKTDTQIKLTQRNDNTYICSSPCIKSASAIEIKWHFISAVGRQSSYSSIEINRESDRCIKNEIRYASVFENTDNFAGVGNLSCIFIIGRQHQYSLRSNSLTVELLVHMENINVNMSNGTSSYAKTDLALEIIIPLIIVGLLIVSLFCWKKKDKIKYSVVKKLVNNDL